MRTNFALLVIEAFLISIDHEKIIEKKFQFDHVKSWQDFHMCAALSRAKVSFEEGPNLASCFEKLKGACYFPLFTGLAAKVAESCL